MGWFSAVFLHFTSGQIVTALKNVHGGLAEDGLFCIGMKLGDFEGWREKGLSDKRYFKFWEVGALRSVIADADLNVLNTYVTPAMDYVVITSRRA